MEFLLCGAQCPRETKTFLWVEVHIYNYRANDIYIYIGLMGLMTQLNFISQKKKKKAYSSEVEAARKLGP
jgi:hypothetical protein